ncbi:uncharacterized protein LOC105697710 [Orussus abietinus]|uniref:uncharacterized protein LOC105697710 n=1 Tax=Orussus abietinus TaxID=222816 RepID=UPI000626EC21|nr:uncharacterized protein LOC105697710 [Orussus abietinus]
MTMTAFHLGSVLSFLLIFLAAFHRGEAIICYQCNSAYDPRCGDPFDPYSLGTVNCSIQTRPEHLSHMEPVLCRKMSQKVYGKVRVVRGCGFITDERDNGECLLRTGTHDVKARYCACTGDLCNVGSHTSPIIGAIATSILFLAWNAI